MQLAIDEEKVASDVAIEQLFQSIALLDTFPEHEDLVDEMKIRLSRLFDDIPEKKGRKIAKRKISYSPNGLCKWSDVQILLQPWESETAKNMKEKPIPYRIVKDINPFWYYQLREYTNTTYTVRPTSKRPVADTVKRLNEYDALSLEEQFLVDPSKIDEYAKETYRLLSRDFEKPHLYYKPAFSEQQQSLFGFLKKEELQALATFMEQSSRDITQHHVLYFISEQFDLMNLEGRPLIDLSGLSDFVIQKKGQWNEYDYQQMIRYLHEQFEQLEDPTLRKIGCRLGILEEI